MKWGSCLQNETRHRSLLDRPSTDSFAMSAFVVQNDETYVYKTIGLVKNMTPTPKEVVLLNTRNPFLFLYLTFLP